MSKAFAGLAFMTWLAASPAIAVETKEFRRTVDLDARGSVSIDTFKGSVEVEAWDQARAEIFARVGPDTTCGNDASQAERVRLTEIDVQSSGSRLKIRSDYDKLKDFPLIPLHVEGLDMACNAHPFVYYRIRMPRTARLEIEDHKSKIGVTGLRSDAKIVSHKGAIDVTDHDGALDLTTHKGDARVEFARLGGDSRFETHKGDVEISLPRSAAFDLEAHVGRAGRLESGFTVAGREWSKRESFYEEKVNGGGPRLELTTHKGDLRLTAK
jgi:Putative adhesin